MIYAAGGVLLAFTLIALFIGGRGALPSWFGWVTLVAGIIGLASFGWFPWFVLLLWSLATGVWLLVASRTVYQAPVAAPGNRDQGIESFAGTR
jgi:membrane protein implicated in regulation of membrane protease activity